MSGYTPQVGHRIEVRNRRIGTVIAVDGLCVTVRAEDGGNDFGMTLDVPSLVVERLPDPEPKWQPGDVVMTAEGVVCERTDTGRWWSPGVTDSFSNSDLIRPLTPLCRDGKLWAEAVGGAS